jgi:hypothetical protein
MTNGNSFDIQSFPVNFVQKRYSAKYLTGEHAKKCIKAMFA